MYFYKRVRPTSVRPTSVRPTSEHRVSESPVQKVTEEKDEILKGDHLSILIKYRPEGNVLIFAKDTTDELKYAEYMRDEMDPLTKVDDRTMYWMIPVDELDDMRAKLLALDREELS